MFNNETGHDALCLWPYRDCHMVCDHLLTWQSHKFETPFAERLWTLSLDGNQDDELGEAEGFGWYALFRSERAILGVTSDGYVQATHFPHGPALELDWAEIQVQYAWSQLARLDTSCGALFLILDTAEHNGIAPDVQAIQDHVRSHQECYDMNAWVLEV